MVASDILFADLSLLAIVAVFGSFTYMIWLVVYRLFLSPLASFPGPKLAAATQWVETIGEFKDEGGMFFWDIRKWHEKYGPIVRISPQELHIQDSEFYNTLYSVSQRLDRPKYYEGRFGLPMSSFATSDKKLHQIRRAALNPFFSKPKIALYSPTIQKHLNVLCDRLEKEYVGTGQILPLDLMWATFTADIIVGYCFERPYNFIDRPDFRSPFTDAWINLLEGTHAITQFLWLTPLVDCLPDKMKIAMNPGVEPVIAFKKEVTSQIEEIIQNRSSPDAKNPDTVFSALFDSNLPPQELSLLRLQNEGISLIGAGLETVMRALVVATFHLLSNPPILKQLQEELETTIPDSSNMPPLATLSQLPFLTACIEEALRLTYGTTQRLTRVAPSSPPLIYKGQVIPPGVTISMDNYSVSHDPAIFENHNEYRPARWLGEPRAPDGRPLSYYMITFGRGPRNCVGMQLAYAELYICLATFVRQFGDRCELYETTRADVDFKRDMLVSKPYKGSKGVRLLLK